jgi:hypothetical protein
VDKGARQATAGRARSLLLYSPSRTPMLFRAFRR